MLSTNTAKCTGALFHTLRAQNGEAVDTQEIMSTVGFRPRPWPTAALNLHTNVHRNISKQTGQVESEASGAINSPMHGVCPPSGERWTLHDPAIRLTGYSVTVWRRGTYGIRAKSNTATARAPVEFGNRKDSEHE